MRLVRPFDVSGQVIRRGIDWGGGGVCGVLWMRVGRGYGVGGDVGVATIGGVSCCLSVWKQWQTCLRMRGHICRHTVSVWEGGSV